MKNITRILALTVLTIIILTGFVSKGEQIQIGASIPKADAKLTDVSGKETNLNEIKTEKGLLVIFSCNTCPFVKKNEGRIKEAVTQARENGLGVAIINSNEATRDEDDSFEAMKAYAEEQQWNINYVIDSASILADAFGATRTPECFLFSKGALVYKGAIDDNPNDQKGVKQKYLRDALAAVAKGKAPKTNSTKSIGCTIKRK